MGSKDGRKKEKIVPLCVYCEKYNISNKRAMCIGIDNSNIESIKEQEFKDILFLCEKLENQERMVTVVPEMNGNLASTLTGKETSDFNLKNPLNIRFQDESGIQEFSETDVKRLKLDKNVTSSLEHKQYLNNILLYSDITLSEVCLDLLESSLPPNPIKNDMKILISDDVDDEQEETTQTLLYTSES